MTTVNIYLYFDGSCEAAFNFYKSVFGGEFTGLARYSDMPNPDQPVPDEEKDKVMHIGLPISKETVLMGSDAMNVPLVAGNNFSITVTPASEEESRRIFDALSADGTVTMPLDKTFWGSLFGMFTDKFGINWMIDYALKQE
jgi:PhnB protein